MAEKMPQTFANHTKLVPLFHYVVLPDIVDQRDPGHLSYGHGVLV